MKNLNKVMLERLKQFDHGHEDLNNEKFGYGDEELEQFIHDH